MGAVTLSLVLTLAIASQYIGRLVLATHPAHIVTSRCQASLPGVLAVKRVHGVPTAFPADEVDVADNLLQVVYDHGTVQV